MLISPMTVGGLRDLNCNVGDSQNSKKPNWQTLTTTEWVGAAPFILLLVAYKLRGTVSVLEIIL